MSIESTKILINKIKSQIHDFKIQIHCLKEDDVSVNFYLNNLKKLSLQGLDLVTAIEKQINLLQNQKRFSQRRKHGVPMVR
jgi:hypothetical protein